MISPAIAPTQPRQTAGTLLLRRFWAIFLRHMFLYFGSWPRLLQMMYWPVINILSWGFTSFYIVKKFGGSTIVGSVLVGGTLLNEVTIRMTLNMIILFLEEFWSRNLGHLFASPMGLVDHACGLIATAFVCLVVGIAPAMLVAYWLFDFSIFSLGWALPFLLVLLVFNGIWVALLVMAMLFRFGSSAEWFGWMAAWLFAPLVAPYYPVSILPHALQYISWCLPATYAFDAMKQVLGEGTVNTHDLWMSLALNIVFCLGSSLIYYLAYRSAQRRGGILQVGE